MKSNVFALTFISLFFSSLAFTQNLTGKVIDAAGNPVPAASIYIREIKQGLICNDDGEFQIRLKAGTYHLEISCVGYANQSIKVQILNQDADVKINLNAKSIQLPELQVQLGEDPAYPIMRKAIEKSPYYQSVIKESTYETYTKGSGKIITIPKLIEAMQKEVKEYKNKLLLQESVSEMKFTEPDHYVQTIKAYSSTMPNSEDPKDAIDMKMISLYRPMFGYIVSPLHPKAFSYYRFRYEGYEEEKGEIINKIKIIPKLNDSRFLEGYIYIADDEWNIRHADLISRPPGGRVHTHYNYEQVLDNIYLVTTYHSDMEMNILGLKFQANFLSTIQYKEIQLNDSLIAVEKSKKKPERKPKNLEIKLDDKLKQIVDTLATKRDPMYWGQVRNIVLNDEEIRSYQRKDSLQVYSDSLKQLRLHPKFKSSDILFGGRFGGDSTKISFRYDGLVFGFPEYNYVDGLWMGQSFGLDIRRTKHTGVKIKPSIHWASARKSLLWNTDVTFNYAPGRLGELTISAGKRSEVFGEQNGPGRFINTIYSLQGASNHAKFYGKSFAKISNHIDLANGLRLGIGLERADRRELANHTVWNIYGIKNKWTPNIPGYDGSLSMEFSQLAKYSVQLVFRPEYYYRMDEGKKEYLRSRFPFIGVFFQQGINPTNKGHNYSKFKKIEFNVVQNIRIGLFDRFSYSLTAGKYLNKNPFNYIDYEHFNTSNQLIGEKTFFDSYSLLDYYRYSTNREWVQAFVSYNTDYLALKRIPFLQGKVFTESLRAKYLYTPDKKHYSEWGYTVGFLGGWIGGAGIFASFDAFKYNSCGFRISLPLHLFNR